MSNFRTHGIYILILLFALTQTRFFSQTTDQLIRAHTYTHNFIMADSKPFPVTVHPYTSKVFRNAALYELGSSSARNTLLFVGGLGDGPHTVPYIRTVAAKIEAADDLSYSVFEIRIRSSFSGFGWNSLATDVEDISAAVKYLRSIGKEKVVLMGHSTGSQVREYHGHVREVICRQLTPSRTLSSIQTMRSITTSLWMVSSSKARSPIGRVSHSTRAKRTWTSSWPSRPI